MFISLVFTVRSALLNPMTAARLEDNPAFEQGPVTDSWSGPAFALRNLPLARSPRMRSRHNWCLMTVHAALIPMLSADLTDQCGREPLYRGRQ